ncbi:MAG: DUF4493 domain-containing protein [Muribaculaceae bacterium]
MKKIYNIIMLMALAAFTFASCDDPTYSGGNAEEGQLKMSTLGIDVDASENVVTKASVDVSGFTVRILDAKSGLLKNSWIFSQMPEVITLPVGDYALEVYNAEVKEAEFDAPYYYAKQNFSIAKNKVTELNPVTCTLENVRVSVEYSEALKNVMSDDVIVTVEVAEKNTLDFGAKETRSGYFRYYETNTTLVASFKGTVDGVYINEDHKIMTDVAPRKHFIITFSYKETPNPSDESGSLTSANFTIDATVTVVNETRNIDITDEIIEPFDYLTTSVSNVTFACVASSQAVTVKSSSAWTVESSDDSWCTISNITSEGFTINATANEASTSRTANVKVTMGNLSKTIKVTQAEFSDVKPAPSFQSDNIDLDNYNDASEFGSGKKSAIVNISAPNGIKSLFVNINSGTLTSDILEGVGLGTQFDLATGKAPDGTDFTEGLVGLGFPVAEGGTMTINGTVYNYDPVLNQTAVEFNITEFMALLGIYGAAKHDFELTVTDNAGLVSKTTIKFETK